MDISTESDLMPTAASDTKDCKSKRIKILKKSITKRNANDKKPYLLKKKLYSIYKKPKRICTNKENEESVGDEDSRDAVALLEDIWSSTNDSLECKARKSKLSKRNVKTILKHVISNEHVIKMVQNTVLAETGHTSNLEEAEFLPRLTRSKVKALQGTSQELMSHNNVGSPTKQNHCVTVPVDHFLPKELAESEDSSDEEYEPSDEAEDTSEGEEEISCSLDTSKDDAGSPTLSPKEASPKSLSADDVYKDSTSMIAEPSLNNTNEFDNQELHFDIESSLSSFSTLHDNIDEPPKISYSSTQTSSDNFNHISQQKAVKDRNDVCIYFQTQYPLKRNLLDGGGGVKKVELDFRRKSSSNRDDVWELPSKRPRSMPTCKKRSSLSKRKGAKNRAQLHSMSPKRFHPDDDNKQSEGSNEFADCYVAEVVNVLRKEPQKLEKFLLTVASFKEDEESYKKLHEHVKEILSGYPSLLEGFSLFKPEKR